MTPLQSWNQTPNGKLPWQLTLSIVEMNRSAAEVMWKRMIKARRISMVEQDEGRLFQTRRKRGCLDTKRKQSRIMPGEAKCVISKTSATLAKPVTAASFTST